MKKFFTLLAAILCGATSFAQSLQLETKDGMIIENGSTVTIKSEMIDVEGYWGQMDPHIYLKNLTDSDQGVFAIMKVVEAKKVYPQICGIGGCLPTSADKPVATIETEILEASSAIDLQIHLQYYPMYYPDYVNILDTCTIELTVGVGKSDNPSEVITATITFTNDPEVLKAASISNTSVTANKVRAEGNVLYCNFVDANARQLQVFDVAGQMKKNVRLNSESTSYSLEGMAKGIYLYRVVEGGKNVLSGKFLVK